MAKSSVIVVGESRLAEELIGVAHAADYDAKLFATPTRRQFPLR
jgi:hypothetical protein